jgi:hypothetical protein
MRRGLIIVFLLILGWQSAGNFYYWLDFMIHRELISTEKCVNRYKKGSRCKGSCQLALKLKQKDVKTERPLSSLKKTENIQLYKLIFEKIQIIDIQATRSIETVFIDKIISTTTEISVPPPEKC